MSGRRHGLELRQALARSEPLIVVNIDYTNASLVEFLGQNGADVILIDCEQGDTDFESIPDLVRAAHIAEVPVIVRLGASDPATIERYMFRGVDGIVVPRLDTPQQAQAVVETVRYCFPASHADKAVIVQIESVSAAQRLDAFLAIDGIDAFFIGPVDLAKSMGQGGDYRAAAVVAEIERITTTILKRGRAAGMLANAESFALLAAGGVSFLYLHTNDFLRNGAVHFTAAKGRPAAPDRRG